KRTTAHDHQPGRVIIRDGATEAAAQDVTAHAFLGAAAAAADGLVADERAVHDRERGRAFVMEGAAVGLADFAFGGGRDRAVAGENLVADERTADDGDARPVAVVPDRSALGEATALDGAVGPVAEEGAVGDREDRRGTGVADGPALGVALAAEV